ncbi:sugar phosphate nucleotidyltransferase [Tenacibaculum sp. SG-28]|uniref:sugar phosphate nucleotidyltransferase n=1 Tax=Tenacibaculum sp. SG-28 TaxID=754426 RepID=UPI000D45EEE0|nr:sugar phosphate nucleotidyltransferase [Tenacibaculum sp. SG-28]PQJ20719.1 hypothetical protein BSU00_10520 [Tenacibaculum sp. SG-28]
MQTTLVILAAGMGSRFGGLKQLSAINKNGETIMDYAVFDAVRVGFTKIVFVIRKTFETEFTTIVTDKFKKYIDIELVFQDIADLPGKFTVNNRIKPWGTGHAIWSARKVVTSNFAVINADDFYGFESLKQIHEQLIAMKETSIQELCMIGFRLKNTLSANGGVSRGICEIDKSANLLSIIEKTNIISKNNTIYNIEDTAVIPLNENSIVSMNMFGLTPRIFRYFGIEFENFLEEYANDEKREFYLPEVINTLVTIGNSKVKVIPTNAKWFGMTYKEDEEIVKLTIRKLTQSGSYPSLLWPQSN